MKALQQNERRCVFFTTQCPTCWLHQPSEGISVTDKIKQSVADVLFGAATKTSLSRMGSPLVQRFLDVHGGREILTSNLCVECILSDVYSAVCRMLKREADKAGTGSLTVDGWQSSDKSPIFGLM